MLLVTVHLGHFKNRLGNTSGQFEKLKSLFVLKRLTGPLQRKYGITSALEEHYPQNEKKEYQSAFKMFTNIQVGIKWKIK